MGIPLYPTVNEKKRNNAACSTAAKRSRRCFEAKLLLVYKTLLLHKDLYI